MACQNGCLICGAQSPPIQMFPCAHRVACMVCLPGIQDRKCPVCKKHVVEVDLPGISQRVGLRAYQAYKIAMDDRMLSNVLQVQFVGQPNSGSEYAVQFLKDLLPVPADTPIEKPFSPCIYGCNSKIWSRLARFEYQSVQEPLHEQFADLAENKPHVVVICVSARQANALEEFKLWRNHLVVQPYTKFIFLLTNGVSMEGTAPKLVATTHSIMGTQEVRNDIVGFCSMAEGNMEQNTLDFVNMIVAFGEKARSLQAVETTGVKVSLDLTENRNE